LLSRAKIIWIRNGEESQLTTDQMVGRLNQGYYDFMSTVTLITSTTQSNGMSPYASVETIQTSNKSSEKSKNDFLITSKINIEVEQDEESQQLYIAKLVHNYTVDVLNNQINP
jgi:hypothetical protein